MLNLEKYQGLLERDAAPGQDEILSCIRYVNPNKQFFVLEPLDVSERARWEGILEKISYDDVLIRLTSDAYFQWLEKDWDIDYQIHRMGFNRIPLLRTVIEALAADPFSYPATLKKLWESREDIKDNYLIQLYNRAYLNIHPNPELNHLKRYIIPRYVTGEMVKDKETFKPFRETLSQIEKMLNDPETSRDDKEVLSPLKKTYMDFGEKYGILE